MLNNNTPTGKTSGTFSFYADTRTEAQTTRDTLSHILENYLTDKTPVIWNNDDPFSIVLCFAGTAPATSNLMDSIITPYLNHSVHRAIRHMTVFFTLTEPTPDPSKARQLFGTISTEGDEPPRMTVQSSTRYWADIT